MCTPKLSFFSTCVWVGSGGKGLVVMCPLKAGDLEFLRWAKKSKVFLANVFKRNAFSKHFTKTSIVAPLLSWSEQTLSCQQRFKCISVQVNYYLTNICPHWWILDECISLFCSVVFIIVEYLFLMQICFVMLIIVFFECIFIVPLLCFLVVAVNLFIIFSAYLLFFVNI